MVNKLDHLKILAVIPARMASTRFPGKPLVPILGKPMIGHVYERVVQSPLLTLTAVATCDQEIMNYVESIGGVAVMTGDHHERASDRCAEALLKLEHENSTRYDIVVMIQGDEPMFHPDMVSEALQPILQDHEVQVVNLLGSIADSAEFDDRNCVKVVCDMHLNALYFSREPIPSRYRKKEVPMGKQVCVIPFRRDFLLQYAAMSPTPLEIVESVDMLRILEHGYNVRMARTAHVTIAVDRPEDIERVTSLMRIVRA